MQKKSNYVSTPPDPDGYCNYSEQDNTTWKRLYAQQIKLLPQRACDEFIDGLKTLSLDPHAIPQLPDVNKTLQATTGWQVTPVPALIPSEEFFALLANREFPAATFIRRPDEFDYLQEPDIFHELFGHTPLLTHPDYAHFVQQYGKLALTASKPVRQRLLRLFWMTIEFGLINTSQGLRIYGGGILSSPDEVIYSLESDRPQRYPFNRLQALRTPYRINIKQPIYFILDSFKSLFNLCDSTLLEDIERAIAQGDIAIDLTQFQS